MHRFRDVVNRMVQHNIPFFLYRLPSDSIVQCGIKRTLFIEQAPIQSFKDKEGFVFAPFKKKSPYFIAPDLTFNLPTELTQLELFIAHVKNQLTNEEPLPAREISKETYITQCNAFIDRIRDGYLKKAILARCVKSKQLKKENAGAHFISLEQKYKDAFVFLVHLPGITTWLGATPETLLEIWDNQFTTMSLAGTQIWVDGKTDSISNWSFKDIEEQKIVTDYICEQLRELGIVNYCCEPLTVKRAGMIGHLQTLIHGNIEGDQISLMIDKLHPTPAVCGYPQKEALELIRNIESQSRDFYAGYLGIKSANKMHLFVNLRSARLLPEYGLLYVGSGITADSDPSLEWNETCLKSQTILNALND